MMIRKGSSAPGFSWTLDCERVLAGGVSRWGSTIRNRRRWEPGGRPERPPGAAVDVGGQQGDASTDREARISRQRASMAHVSTMPCVHRLAASVPGRPGKHDRCLSWSGGVHVYAYRACRRRGRGGITTRCGRGCVGWKCSFHDGGRCRSLWCSQAAISASASRGSMAMRRWGRS